MTDTNENKSQRYYITKYALTMGILVRDLEPAPTDGYAGYYQPITRMWEGFNIDVDCFLDKYKAIAKAELMKKRAIDNANKKIRKLEAMTSHLEFNEE